MKNLIVLFGGVFLGFLLSAVALAALAIVVDRAGRGAPGGAGRGASYDVRMPDGQLVSATFRGYLSNASQLPLRGGAADDMYTTCRGY